MAEPPKQDQGPGPARYAGLGIQLAASIFLFVFGGQWLDRRLGSGALFTILGAFVGFGGTMVWIIHRLNADQRDDK